MLVHNCIQGSGEWLKLRCGIPTASEFDSIFTPAGKPSKSAERYMFALLAERIMGHPRTESVSTWMDRGSQMEAEAVSFYELQRDCETVKVGFVSNDEKTIGASPDRLVGDDGLLEIKVPAEHTHVSYLLKKAVDQAYYPQVQGQLWITERKWADILSYHPEMPPALIRVDRDEEFIAKLSEAVEGFSRQLEEMTLELVKRGWITIPKIIESPWDDLEVTDLDIPPSSAPPGAEAGSRLSSPQPPPAATTHAQPGDDLHLTAQDVPQDAQNSAVGGTTGKTRTLPLTPPDAWTAQMLALSDEDPVAFKKKMDSLGYSIVHAVPMGFRQGVLEAMRLAVR